MQGDLKVFSFVSATTNLRCRRGSAISYSSLFWFVGGFWMLVCLGPLDLHGNTNSARVAIVSSSLKSRQFKFFPETRTRDYFYRTIARRWTAYAQQNRWHGKCEIQAGGGDIMTRRHTSYLATSLFGAALLAVGCAAREVDVRTPVQGQATVEGDTSAQGRGKATSESQNEQNKRKSSGQGSSNPGY
jgi:hypothetical protein